MKLLFFIPLIFFAGIAVQGQEIQRYNTYGYNVNEGLLQSTIDNIEFDQNNFCWLSYPNGIQKFDGKNFISVPLQAGLQDDKLAVLFRCSNGDLLVSHSKGISRYGINNNRFAQVYFFHDGEKTSARFIGEDGNIVYFYHGAGNITGIDSRTYKIVSEKKTGFPDYSTDGTYHPKFSDNIINHKVAIHINETLYLWDLQQGKMLWQPAPVPNAALYFLRLRTETKILYFSYKINNALQLHDFSTGTNTSLVIKGKDDKPIGRCCIYYWRNKILISFNNRLYETDSTLQTLKAELVNLQNQPIAGITSIARIQEDNFGNLFLQTVTGGIKKVIFNPYTFKYFSTGKAEENIITSILPDKKRNRILAGTSGNGLLLYDTLQHLIKNINSLPGKKLGEAVNGIIKKNDGTYFIFIAGEKQVWQLSADLLQWKAIPISTTLPANKSGIQYFGNILFQSEQQAIMQSQQRIFKVNFAANTVSEYDVTAGYTMSGLLYNNLIITHTNDELIFLDTATLRPVKKISFKNTGYVRCFTKNNTGKMYVGSNKGIFVIDSSGNILQQLNKENGLPDECIYAMAVDEESNLWCSSNKGIFRIDKNNHILHLKKQDGLQENEFNTNVFARTPDGELFFGGSNGVSSFYPASIKTPEAKLQIFLTGIAFNNQQLFADTATAALDKIELPYDKNSLSFNFVAMGPGNTDEYVYQYRMKGVDAEWLPNGVSQTIHYFLPPENYVLEIYAGLLFDKNAKPLKTISIIIRPPFWKTWWFRSMIALLLFAVIAFAINILNRKKYQKKLLHLETEHKVQLERERISRDLHDSIGAYANAVLYNTELLQQQKGFDEKNELMNDLKFASKDIITALRDTVWALKKDEYTAQDCLIRIRNFIQPFNRYYNQIAFTVEGDAPAEMQLHYTHALDVVRIIQEAVTNAIKHAAPSYVKIQSEPVGEKWKLSVTDDGKGFHTAGMSKDQEGNGLDNMQQRADSAGFALHITSAENEGTCVSILVAGNISG